VKSLSTLAALFVSAGAVAAPVDAVAPTVLAPPVLAPAAPAATAPPLVPSEACLPPAPEDDDAEGADEEGADEEGEDDEGEDDDISADIGGDGVIYSGDLSDAELQRLWRDDLEALGSMSVGFPNAGRIINGVQFPSKGGNWKVIDPTETWGTQETVDALIDAIVAANARLPDMPPLRINDISKKDGGWHKPHRSHQSGRDVDIGFYYPGDGAPIILKKRERCIDVARNWALVRALVTGGLTQIILVDKRVAAVLHGHARSIGEDEAWLEDIFRGPTPLIKHAPGHRDHFHVRFYNPRAQELGRRVQPLLAQRPEHNIFAYTIRRGDTLSAIARRHGSTVALIQKLNRVSPRSMQVGRILSVPLLGPCNHCPLPPPMLVPPPRLPPVVTGPFDSIAQASTPPTSPIRLTRVSWRSLSPCAERP
jgi:LysM repeat protein